MLENGQKQAILDLLEQGELEMEGLVPWGSNYTFLVQVCRDEDEISAIYKPSRGERPLWDFARGTLSQRERAAFLVSEALGWNLVPPTIIRDGPHGTGSVQYFIEHDTQEHYLTLKDRKLHQVKEIALFDVIINNADRKSGHVLLGFGNRLWAIDHGVCFHSENKLRSVIWEFAGEIIPEQLLEDLSSFQRWLAISEKKERQELNALLSARELEALSRRLELLIEDKRYPLPGPGRHYPWPLV